MLRSFRDAIEYYNKLGHVQEITKEVDTAFEIAGVLSILDSKSIGYFKKIKGYDMSVVGNLLYSRERFAEGLGVTTDMLQAKLVEAITNTIPPKMQKGGPCQEIISEQNPDVLKYLPVPKFFEFETGPYITAGLIIAKNPVTGKRNVTIARCKILEGNRLMLGIAPNHHLSRLLQESLSMGKELEIAIAIGNCPAMIMASNFYVDYGFDEYDIAGGLLGEAIALTKCKDVDLEVPAEAEIIIEGRLGGEKIEEGPVSEFPGMYVNYGYGSVMEVSTITHRRDAIFQTIVPGYRAEHHLIGGEAIGATLLYNIRKVVSHTVAVHIPKGACGRLQAIISLHNPMPGDGHRAVFAAFSHCSLIKHVVVVDDDIDVTNGEQVNWAIATRMRGEKDIFMIPEVKSDRSDPMEDEQTITKIGLIAIKNSRGPRKDFTKTEIPAAIMEKIKDNWDEYIS